MSWTIFLSGLFLSGLLGFYRSDRRTTVLAVASALLATWLVGKYALAMLVCLETLFWLLKRKALHSSSSRFDGWGAIGVAIGLLPFATQLVLGSVSTYTSIGTSAIFAFFSLQVVGGFIQIRYSDKPSDLTRSEWYNFGLFFPTLITGPIAKWSDILAQILEPRRFQIDDGLECLRLVVRGLFKRIVFATPFYLIANEAIAKNSVTHLPVLLIFAAGLRFAIWADISGYTDWARGLSIILGFKLPENFDRPFQTFSVIAFWSRWHITLTSWIQEYVYHPLLRLSIMRRLPKYVQVAIAISLSFLFLGIWHGLRGRFIIMGLLHGAGLLFSFSLHRKWPRAHVLLSPVLFFGFVILPTALLKVDSTTFFKSLFAASEAWSTTVINLKESIIFLTRAGIDRNPLGWIGGTAILWQIYEKFEAHGWRLPALAESFILLTGILVLAIQGSASGLFYVQ